MFPFDRHTRLRESLSVYIDGALTDVERTRLESHLATCDACRNELEGLRAASEALRGLPAIAAPRSFALTEAMVQSPARAPAGYSPVLNTAMRLSAAGLAVALAAVMVVDRTSLGGDDDAGGIGEQTARSLEQADTQMLSSGEDAASDGSPQVNPINDAGSGGDGAPAEAPEATGAPAGLGALGETPAATGANQDLDKELTRDSEYQFRATGEAEADSLPPSEQDEGAQADAFAATSGDDGGLGAIGVIEIVLAVLLGSAIGGALALTAARKQSGVGTN
jgi:hypothetical protein